MHFQRRMRLRTGQSLSRTLRAGSIEGQQSGPSLSTLVRRSNPSPPMLQLGHELAPGRMNGMSTRPSPRILRKKRA